MISPKVYEKQIKDLEIEGKEIIPKNKDDAIILFDELEDLEKILEKIRYNIRMDIRVIRKNYMDGIKEIEDNSKKNPKVLKNKIKEKKQLIAERDFKIAPYESLEYTIDDYLNQIKSAKKYISSYIS